MKGKKVLITGALGLLGKVLVTEYIKTNTQDELVLVDVLAYEKYSQFLNMLGKVRNKIHYFQVDILDEGKLRTALLGCDTVFHLAGIISYDKRLREKMYDVNVNGTKLITKLSSDVGAKRIVYASSISAIALLRNSIASESDYPESNAPYLSEYSKTKIEAENVFFEIKSEKMIKVAANLGVIVGDNVQFRTLVNTVKKSPILPLLPTYNSYIDVQDAAKALIFLLHYGVNGERYIVTGSNEYNSDVFKIIAKILNIQPLMFFIPKKLLRLIYAGLNLLKPLLQTDAWKSMCEEKRFSTQKIRDLGWSPQATIDESLNSLVKTMNQKGV